jgi:hypothetical protein
MSTTKCVCAVMPIGKEGVLTRARERRAAWDWRAAAESRGFQGLG